MTKSPRNSRALVVCSLDDLRNQLNEIKILSVFSFHHFSVSCHNGMVCGEPLVVSRVLRTFVDGLPRWFQIASTSVSA